MSKIEGSSEPATELERLIADLSGSGQLVFVFGDGVTTGTWSARRHRCSGDPPTCGRGTSSSAMPRQTG